MVLKSFSLKAQLALWVVDAFDWSFNTLKIGMIKKLSLGQLLVAKLALQEHQLAVSL